MGYRGTLLTIAGFDPSSGAGVTADLQVFTAHGFFGISAITALTVQSTVGVQTTKAVDAEWLTDTLRCLADDLPADGIKIGMLATAENVEAVAAFLSGLGRRVPVVLDPVMVSSSGRALLNEEGVQMLRERLLPQVDWVTPNRAELARLTGRHVSSRAEMEAAGRELARDFAGLNVVVTGGDLDSADDCVVGADGVTEWLAGARIPSYATHGTGCAFSSALLCRVYDTSHVQNVERVFGAKRFVAEAIRTAVPMGRGKGPMNLGIRNK